MRLWQQSVAQLEQPDATMQMQSGVGEIAAHFTWVPYSAGALAKPGMRMILSTDDVFGVPISSIAITSTKKFVTENPKIYAAFLAAQEEATNLIYKNPRTAAEIFAKLDKDATPAEELEKMITDPRNKFTLTPINSMKLIEFLHETGVIKTKPATWKDIFFPGIHNLQGS